MDSRVVLAFLVVYIGLAFGWRSWLQHRRTGSTGFRGVSGRPFSLAWWGGLLLVVGFAGTIAAPLVGLAGVSSWSVHPIQSGAGAVALLLGLVGTVAGQLTMGDSWRIGVDASERTALVTGGVFAHVRNPIFTSMLLVAAGVALVLPGWLSIAGFAVALLGLELQVRFVEEPWLLRSHGDYAAYAARVGRFVPGLGRLRRRHPAAQQG